MKSPLYFFREVLTTVHTSNVERSHLYVRVGLNEKKGIVLLTSATSFHWQRHECPSVPVPGLRLTGSMGLELPNMVWLRWELGLARACIGILPLARTSLLKAGRHIFLFIRRQQIVKIQLTFKCDQSVLTIHQIPQVYIWQYTASHLQPRLGGGKQRKGRNG
jgi:hypothetical protein